MNETKKLKVHDFLQTLYKYCNAVGGSIYLRKKITEYLVLFSEYVGDRNGLLQGH